MSRAPSAAAWRFGLGLYGLVALGVVLRSIAGAGMAPLFYDTDDAMRLVTVRRLLDGQGWTDLTVPRLNTPFGAEMHWSRLVDAALGGPLLLLRPLFGPGAETVLAYLWPVLLLGGLMGLSAALAMRLAGREGMLPGLVLPILSPAVLPEFSPGRIDHHNLLLLLALGLVLLTLLALERPRLAALAGAVAATALAIGIEALPMAVAAMAVYGLAWVLRPDRGVAMRLFGLGFAAATLLHLGLARPPARWLEPACDMISWTYAVAALGAGLGLTLLSVLPLQGALARLLAGLLLGGAGLIGLALAFPQCLGGPYAGLDPFLQQNWLSRIGEAKTLLHSLQALPDYSVAVTLPAVLGLIGTGLALRASRGPERERWLVLAVFLGVAVVLMLAQVRGARTVAVLATPAGAWLIVHARHQYLAAGGWRAALALLGLWLAFAGIAVSLLIGLATGPWRPPSGPAAGAAPGAATSAAGPPGKLACLMPQAFAGLAALPPERLLAPIDLGAHLLMQTPHAVVAAPYHRAAAGVLDTFRFFNAAPDAARDVLDRRGVSLIVVCSEMPEMQGFADAAPDSVVRLLAAGRVPDWLVEVTPPGGVLRLFTTLPR